MNRKGLIKLYDRIADAPDAVERLRKFVLSIAVRGKLVAPDPGDESPLEFLKRIVADKTESAAGIARPRQPTKIRPLVGDNLPFRIPANWLWAAFGDITTSRDGERIPVSRAERQERAKIYDYYGASGVIDKIDNYLFDKPLLLIGEDGANLINRSTPIAFIARGKYWVNNHAHVLDAISEEFLSYLELFINAIDLKPYVTGTAQPKMNQAKMNSIPVAVPPVGEQRRIIEKVDELMTLCDRLDAAREEQEGRRNRLTTASLARLNMPDPDTFRNDVRFALDAFSALTARPEQIKQLRQTILKVAVHGKLVPQNPKDQPATELLKHIAAEKERLMTAGKLKKDKDPWDGLTGEPPYHIPQGWAWARIQDIFEVSRGGSPRPAGDPLYFGGTIPWITVREITKDEGRYLVTTEGGVTELGATRSRLIKPGDLLLTNSGATLGVPKISRIQGCINDGVALLRQFHSIDLNEFAYLYLCSQTHLLRQINQGMGQPNLNTPIIAGWFFPLPPLAEQHRIVAMADELIALCEALQANMATADSTRAHLLAALLTEGLISGAEELEAVA